MNRLIENYEIQLVEHGCAPGAGRWGALVSLGGDISEVFPYLNAVLPDARYDHDNRILIWVEEGQQYALRPNEIRIGHVEDLAQARGIVSKLADKVNRVWQERGNITPRLGGRKLPPVIDLFKLLPGTNCRQCGYPSCMAFAADLRKRAARLESCLPLSQPENAGNREKLSRLASAD